MHEPLGQTLSLPLTSLIGRAQELATLCQLLRHPAVRLLTITGPGGVGKTRLARHAAVELQPDFIDGVLFIPLDAISDPGLVVATIAATLGLREEGKRPLLERIQHHLADQQVLLVLDNFEQVLDAAPALVEILLACPETKTLVTSRAPLRVQGEHELAVPLFPLPDLQQLRRLTRGLVAATEQNAAIRLFAQRVKMVAPAFELTDENVVTIAQICALLDGLPLAIELAAARIKLFSPQALLMHLNATAPDGPANAPMGELASQPSLALLTNGARDLPARQQTLRNAIAWSYRLLTPTEQRLFPQLAIFVGGFTWHAAQAVLLGQPPAPHDAWLDPALLDHLTSLVDKGLLLQTQVAGEPRFSMLVTIREFALEQLQQDGQQAQLEQTHAAYFLQLTEASQAYLFGPQQGEYLARLVCEQDNLRAVLRRALRRQDYVVSMRLAATLWRFWLLRGDTSEGAQWLEQALALFRQHTTPIDAPAPDETAPDETAPVETPVETAQAHLLTGALLGAGILAIYQNQYQHAMTALQEALALARKLGDNVQTALALHAIARIAMRTGQLQQAEKLYRESMALFRQQGNQWGIAQAMLYWGLTLWVGGRFTEAHAVLEDALTTSRQIDDPQAINQAMEALAWAKLGLHEVKQAQQLLESSVAMARVREDRGLLVRGLHGLGSVLRQQGNAAAAHAALAESFLVAFELGDHWHIAGSLLEIAQLAFARGGADRAAHMVGACEYLFPAVKTNAPASSAALYADLTAKLRAKLGERAYATALAAGVQVAHRNELASWEQLIDEATPAALATTTLPAAPVMSSVTPLTEREQEVLHLLAQGLTNMQIAERLVVSPFTINAHLRNIYNKLDVPSRPAAIRYALEHHLA